MEEQITLSPRKNTRREKAQCPTEAFSIPSSSQYCTAARDDYCRKAGVQESTPEHEDAGLLVLALFHQGATTAEALAAALENRLQSEESVVLPNGDTTDNAYAAHPIAARSN